MPQAPWRWASTFAPLVTLLLMRKSLAAWLVHHPVSGTCDYPHGYSFCWFAWCLRFFPETFHFLHSNHAPSLGNYPAAGIWLAQADGGLPYRGPIPPCSITILTSTQVLPTDGANYRVRVREVLRCRCEQTQTQQAQYNEFGK